MNPRSLRVNVLALWTGLLLLKFLLAARLPLFVDEAFYAWEGRRLDWAYSDLPGLTAWLARLGTELGGQHALALRAPFLLLGALVPWLAWRIATRWFGRGAGERAALLAMLMPLAGLLGVLALPDVPLVVAALLCVDAIARLRERITPAALATLGLGLVLGAFSHYRFALVLLAGAVGVALDRRCWPLLREPRVLAVLALGALAWWPLLRWNLQNAGAGIAFQVSERNPWAFDARGLAWIPIQALLVTPPLFVLLLASLRMAWARRAEAGPWALVAGIGLVAVLGYALLGLFADRQRVSFHWPLSGWVLLCCVSPVLLARWSRVARITAWSAAALGLAAACAFLLAASDARLRAALADSRLYPNDIGGAAGLHDWARASAALPASPARAAVEREQGVTWLAGDFGTAARLAFALGEDDVRVLDSPANRKHGRAAQLRAWSLDAGPAWLRQVAAGRAGRVRLVVDDGLTPMKHRLALYHALCAQFGALPVPQLLSADHGRRRYLVYEFGAGHASRCAAPALAWIDVPAPGATLPARFELQGWAFKDGVGLRRVEVLLDGRVAVAADYGATMPGVRDYWKISSDPNHPRVGVRATVDVGALPPGKHWLGLRLHGADGSVEDWPEQSFHVAR